MSPNSMIAIDIVSKLFHYSVRETRVHVDYGKWTIFIYVWWKAKTSELKVI